jgi:hypothetical protein
VGSSCRSASLDTRLLPPSPAVGPTGPQPKARAQVQGETDFHEPFTVGVVRGTGAYQNAGGQITVERTLADGTTDVETLRLIFFETG